MGEIVARPVAAGGSVALPSGPGDAVSDLRFRALVGEAAWSRLPEAVRARFSKRIAPGEMKLYCGRVVATELSPAGRMLAALARIIGAPLPLTDGAVGPAHVAVIEDAALGGQSWTRTYARPGRFAQVVHSVKRFQGPTGLEEYVGAGIGMTLRISEREGALHFRSERYFLEIGAWRVYCPRLLEPGVMEIVHRQEAGEEFSFRLTLIHPRFGTLLNQLATFTDD